MGFEATAVAPAGQVDHPLCASPSRQATESWKSDLGLPTCDGHVRLSLHGFRHRPFHPAASRPLRGRPDAPAADKALDCRTAKSCAAALPAGHFSAHLQCARAILEFIARTRCLSRREGVHQTPFSRGGSRRSSRRSFSRFASTRCAPMHRESVFPALVRHEKMARRRSLRAIDSRREIGAAGRNRTHDPLVRSQVLYPAELQPPEPKSIAARPGQTRRAADS